MRIFSPTGRKKMITLLAVLVGFVVTDGVLTEMLFKRGTAREFNPFLRPLIGDVGFMVLKVVGSLLVALILWDIYRRFPRVAVIATWIAIVGYGAIVLWNVSLFLII
jgi:hypothetical protein